MSRSTTSSSRKVLRPLQLAAVIFLTVSGGPYGLEPLLSYVGKQGAFLLLLVTPLLWDVPTVLTVLELNGMMPVNGGYYQWVKRALGMRFAFYEGWWTWLYTFVDLAIYPVLFVEYASFFIPALAAWKIPVCLLIIWSCAALNIRGIVSVGKTSVWLSAIVLLPFLVLFVVTAMHTHTQALVPVPSLKGLGFSSIGMGLYTVMWNFLGWDNATTYAEEVDRPVRSYLIAVSIAFFLVFFLYIAITLVAQQSGMDVAAFSENGFPALGMRLGGFPMGALFAVGGMASTLGLFSAVLLSMSRVPKAMADDKLLPVKISALHQRFNTPHVSIITCAVVVSGMVLWTFADLMVIDVTVYGAALMLEFVSLIVLRIKAPGEHRPFRIPLGIPGLCIMVLIPFTVYAIALSSALITASAVWKPLGFAIGTLLTAEIAWRILSLRRKWMQAATDPVLTKQQYPNE
ncbi:APC family permease [Deminuibacter soli]|uniref:APC family permease n=1 Tax=Deminuibacter soli TaxID=2291815 RepID=A0A3E1NNL2_9BACT|nr:APC family permease [Deminuibacter soli]RFM29519.1 APC family permease [Deminuibacter soli]